MLRRFIYLLSVMTLLSSLSSFGQTISPPLKELPLAPLPIMGWGSWNHFGRLITEADVRAATDILVSSGLKDLGYTFVNIDGSWQGQRDENGVLQINHRKFHDMKALGDYVHSKGLKFGIYSSPGPETCGGFTASYMHEEQDAKMFADWGVDYLKYDLCTYRLLMKAESNGDHAKSVAMQIAAYEKMHQALLKTGRPIYYALCQYGLDHVWEWAPKVGATMYRTTGDMKDNYDRMEKTGFTQAGLAKYVTPGHWLDPDGLEIGNGGMTADEYRMHMSLWAMVAAPLILGNDLTKLDEETMTIIGNKEVIAVDQDPLVKPGDRVWAVGQLELWSRPLKDGKVAICLFNRANDITTMSFHLSDIGWKGSAKARDVWAHKNIATISNTFTADVPQHGVVMLILSN